MAGHCDGIYSRELLGGGGGCKVAHFFLGIARLCNSSKDNAIKEFCSQGRICR